MPLPEDATLFIRIWTGQTCKACGSEFHYLRRYSVPRSQTDINATQASVEAAYVKAATETSEVAVPCPHCGYIQPDMVANRKAVRHGILTFAVFLLLLLNTFAAAFDLLPVAIAAFIAVSLAGAALIFHIWQIYFDFNRDSLANLARAQQLVQQGMLRLVKTSEGPAYFRIPKPVPRYLAAIGLLVAAAVFLILPAVSEAPFWLCEVAGTILFIWSGSQFANTALDIRTLGNPRQVIEVDTTQVLDDTVP
jgi:hypothetical protein